MDAPLCWMGGKSRLQKTIVQQLPQHTSYIEVFGGAGWVLFGKQESPIEVYNDIDGELVNFFNVVKNCHRAFLQALDLILISRKLFTDFIRTEPEDLDEIQRAVRFYYVVRTSYSGKWYGASYGYNITDGRNGIDLDTVDGVIRGVHRRLRHVNVENDSFAEILKRYDSPETLFYLDPPYFETARYWYMLTEEDYCRLCEILAGIRGKFLVSINDHPRMRELFRGYNIEEVEVPYFISRKKEARQRYGELLIRNYEREDRLL